MIREQPWHIRRASHWHHQWYRDLMELQKITLGWLKELNIDRPSHFLGPSVNSAVRESIRGLEQAADLALQADTAGGLESLLDDTSPDDCLGRIEMAIQSLQGWTLRSILDRTPPDGLASLLGQLEQSSWKSGAACGALRWKNPDPAEYSDLRAVLFAFRDNPLCAVKHKDGILVRRAIRREISLELRICPHQSGNAAIASVASELCSLYSHWIRGFVYSLNPKVYVDYQPGSPTLRCVHQWRVTAEA